MNTLLGRQTTRHPRRGRLQTRLTVLMLGVLIPLIGALVIFVSERAGELITQSAIERLTATNRALVSNTSLWLALNANALQELASQSAIISMDPEQQKPLLEKMAEAYPHIYLVSTTDWDGLNVARSDALPLQNYRGQLWHTAARNGVYLTYEVFIDETTNRPALAASVPIMERSESFVGVVGVAMFASDLTDITQAVQANRIGQTGFAYIVDAHNRVVAHADPTFTAQLQELDTYPPVSALRQGKRGTITFTDDDGERWQAHIGKLDNDWGVIVQQQESELLQGLTRLRRTAWSVTLTGVVALSILAWLIFRQTFKPIEQLTGIATAVAAGNLDYTVPIERSDEIGILGEAFNSMTERLRELIGGLERRVEERTRALEQRSAFLEASAEVARAASSILDTGQLIQEVVELIRERFDLYYVGLFLVDEPGEWAVLRAGTGEAGEAMLARDHRIEIGQGMIGWSIAHAQARIALEAGEDTVRLATAELPDTQSEAALPLRSRGQVIGALTVQSDRPEAFDQETIVVLQTMADQVAVALDNARLFTESQSALETARRAYGEISREAWAELLRAQSDLCYHGNETSVTVADIWRPEMEQALLKQETVQSDGASDEKKYPLAVPIKVRGDVIGVLNTQKPVEAGEWTSEEITLLETLADQLSVALEGARLYQEAQQRAAHEQLISDVTTRIRETLDLETMLRIAAREVRQALSLPEVTVRLAPPAAVDTGDGADGSNGHTTHREWPADGDDDVGS